MTTAAASRVRHALAEALGVVEPVNTDSETLDVKGAAALLHTTVRAIYQRRHAGQMPTPVTKRPLVWRKQDLLKLPK